MKYLITITFIIISLPGHSQTDSIQSFSHIFWSADNTVRMGDFQDTIGNQNYKTNCDSLDLCWGASIGLFSVLDEPKRKSKRGKLFEKIYFAPAFEKASSYRLNDDTLGYLKQVIVFDMYELTARKCRKDLQYLYEQMPFYGTLYINFKTVEARNKKILEQLISTYTNEVYVQNIEDAYERWRKLIDKLLSETIEYQTTNMDRIRFILDRPLNKDYQMAKTVMGSMSN